MKTDVFYWLLNACIYGSLIGILLLIVRSIRKIPRRVIYILWAIPLLRFWMPFGLTSRFSLLSLISKYATKTVILGDSPFLSQITASNVIQAADAYFPILYKSDPLERVFSVSSVVWLIGLCTIVLTGILLYVFTMSAVKNARCLRDNIYVSDRVTAPALYGILKPKIMIPTYMEDDDLHYILQHEKMHIRRKDNLFRCIALLTAALHWFNPLIWVFLKCYYEDLELACDERVIAKMAPDSRIGYARALVHVSETRSAFVSAFGGAKIRVRIENILSYRAMTVLSLSALILLIVITAVTLLTNAII